MAALSESLSGPEPDERCGWCGIPGAPLLANPLWSQNSGMFFITPLCSKCSSGDRKCDQVMVKAHHAIFCLRKRADGADDKEEVSTQHTLRLIVDQLGM